jgi:outer membrane protein
MPIPPKSHLLANTLRLALGGAALLIAPLGMAQSQLVDNNNSAQSTVQDLSSTTNSSGKWTLGLGAVYMPSYEGSDEHKTRALPIISYKSGRLAAGIGGISYNFSPNNRFEFGPRLSLRGGRDESDADRLRGLGDIDIGVDLGLFARWHLAGWTLQADVKHGMGDAEGSKIGLGVDHTTSFGAADVLRVGAELDWTDSKYTQAYFGVDARQSARSGLASYSAGAGIKSYGANAVWIHSFTPAVFSMVGLHYKRLAGDAADSPITEEKNMVGVSATVGYRF